MAVRKSQGQATVIAVYPDHASAEHTVRRLRSGGIPMQNVSIVGKDFEGLEKPFGSDTSGKKGAKVGPWEGGIFGVLNGTDFVILPGVGPIVVAGPLAAALLGGIEEALAGAAFVGLRGTLLGLGVSKEKAIRYESQITAGKFLVALQADEPHIERAIPLVSSANTEAVEVVAPVAMAA
jgi:hypothetical protein